MRKLIWVGLRILAVFSLASSIVAGATSKTNMDLTGCFLVSIFTGISLFTWLYMIRNRQDIDWTSPVSLTEPFWPMMKYPIRFWLVAAVSMIAGGAISVMRGTSLSSNVFYYGAAFLLWGISTMLAIGANVRIRNSRAI